MKLGVFSVSRFEAWTVRFYKKSYIVGALYRSRKDHEILISPSNEEVGLFICFLFSHPTDYTHLSLKELQ